MSDVTPVIPEDVQKIIDAHNAQEPISGAKDIQEPASENELAQRAIDTYNSGVQESPTMHISKDDNVPSTGTSLDIDPMYGALLGAKAGILSSAGKIAKNLLPMARPILNQALGTNFTIPTPKEVSIIPGAPSDLINVPKGFQAGVDNPYKRNFPDFGQAAADSYYSQHGLSAPGVNSADANRNISAANANLRKAGIVGDEAPRITSHDFQGNSYILTENPTPDQMRAMNAAAKAKSKQDAIEVLKAQDEARNAQIAKANSIRASNIEAARAYRANQGATNALATTIEKPPPFNILKSKPISAALPLLGLPAAGAMGMDAMNRLDRGDYLGSAISGVGALGTAAVSNPFFDLIPGVAEIAGGVGLAAPALNAGIDYAKKTTPKQFQKDVFQGTYGQSDFSNPGIKKKFAEGGMVETAPSEGGLNYRDYPHPFQNPNANGGGLRAYQKPDGSYGGEMIPKSTGLLGELKGTGPNAGKTMTEFSIGDETGDYPSLVPTLDSEDIKNVLNGTITPEVSKKARAWSDSRKAQGMSPFYNPPGFAEGGEVDSTLPPVSVTAPRPSPEEMRQYLATHDENTGEPLKSFNQPFKDPIVNVGDALNTGYNRLKSGQAMLTGEPISQSLDEQFKDPMNAMNFLPAGGAENAMAGVVKDVGGNWAPNTLETYLHHNVTEGRSPEVKNWYDTILKKYIQNRMGTPEDEIRKLADEGITHIKSDDPVHYHPNARIGISREAEGFPEEGMATTRAGHDWENASDRALTTTPAAWGNPDAFPWLNKLDPNTPLYTMNPDAGSLGFHKMGDMLESDIKAGKLTPEQLAQMSVEKAVRRTHSARENQTAQAQVAQQTLPTVKEYPNGFHWKELTHEDPTIMKSVLNREGETMQNCVKGYDPEDMAETGTRIFSLRDPAGNPHVNIEVKPDNKGGQQIKQILGKQNSEPIDAYKPYTQDFGLNPIHGEPYSKIDDFENAGLLDVTNLKKYGIIPSGPLRDKVLGEVGRIHPTEISPTGGRVSSGQHGTRLNTDELLPNLLKDLPGNYTTPEQLVSHLQTKATRPVQESYSKFYEQPSGMKDGGVVQAITDAATMPFIQHSLWYENNLPPMLDKYSNKIGAKRIEGGPRDTAAEFAGAADYGQRAPADYNRALENATYYQNTRNTGKNAADNLTQDAAGLALGMCNPLMTKKNIVKQAVKYGLSNDFSE